MYANLGACCVCCLLPAQQLRAVVADDRMQLFDMHKPVIACIHGNCLAGGNDVAGLCDLIVCAEDATFAFPPARDLGCLPNQMWFYHLGPQWTKRLALTGDSVDGKTAAEIGLALKCVPAEDLEEEVEGIADRMCLIDPECVSSLSFSAGRLHRLTGRVVRRRLLAANKRQVNTAMELMGARTSKCSRSFCVFFRSSK